MVGIAACVACIVTYGAEHGANGMLGRGAPRAHQGTGSLARPRLPSCRLRRAFGRTYCILIDQNVRCRGDAGGVSDSRVGEAVGAVAAVVVSALFIKSTSARSRLPAARRNWIMFTM